jgi:hypothetical protein
MFRQTKIRGSTPCRVRDFSPSHLSRLVLGRVHSPIQWVTDAFPMDEASEAYTAHSPPYSDWVKDGWRYNLTPPL